MAENQNSENFDLDDLLNESPDDVTNAPSSVSAQEAIAGEDDLLSEIKEPDVIEPVAPKEPVVAEPIEPELSPEEQAEIDALQQALSAPAPEAPVLSPGQLKIQELKAQLAAKQESDARVAEEIAENAPLQYEKPREGAETILLHFVNDGLIACGQSWYRGQELEFEIGGRAYKEQFDRKGKSWLDLLDDIDGQYERWGEQKIARGPWRGKRFSEAPIPSEIPPAEHAAYRAALQNAESAERRRGRAAPILR